MSPKQFTMATIALCSASEQNNYALVVCDSEYPPKRLQRCFNCYNARCATWLAALFSLLQCKMCDMTCSAVFIVTMQDVRHDLQRCFHCYNARCATWLAALFSLLQCKMCDMTCRAEWTSKYYKNQGRCLVECPWNMNRLHNIQECVSLQVCPTRTCTVSSLGQISTEHVIWCLEHVTLLFSVVVNSNVNIEMYLLLAVFDLVAVEQAFMHTETGRNLQLPLQLTVLSIQKCEIAVV